MSERVAIILKRQEEMLAKVERLEKRVSKIEEELKSAGLSYKVAAPEAGAKGTLGIIVELLDLPDNLRKTALAISVLGDATAVEVAEKTGRTRNIESVYLNQLVRVRYLEKVRRGKKVFFKVKRPLEDKFVEIAKRLI